MVRRLLQLYVGLGLYGLSTAMFIRSDLGVDPWDVFHLGVGMQLGMTIGTVIIVTGAAVLLLWIPLRQMPGLGTISNVICIGLAADASMALIPELDSLAVRIAFLVSGIVMNAIATSMYIGAGFGPGPRDGLMTGIHARLGWSIRSVRTSIEVSVLLIGCVLGPGSARSHALPKYPSRSGLFNFAKRSHVLTASLCQNRRFENRDARKHESNHPL